MTFTKTPPDPNKARYAYEIQEVVFPGHTSGTKFLATAEEIKESEE